jgi:superfamily II DNA/RNA helicase
LKARLTQQHRSSSAVQRMSISGQPFKSPAPVAEESKADWSSLGLLDEVQTAVDAMGFAEPSPIQRIAIPQIMSGGNLVVAAATGSGKTLAYLLPTISALKGQEATVGAAAVRMVGRPRALVLVPTRELAAQVLGVSKTLSHKAKFSSCGVFGGEDYGKQKRELAVCQDVVVGSPGRILKHRDQGALHLSQVSHH